MRQYRFNMDNKLKFHIWKILIPLVLGFYLHFFVFTQSCEESLDYFKKSDICKLVIDKTPDTFSAVSMELSGLDTNNMHVKYKITDRGVVRVFKQYIKIGDTFIKQNNSSIYILATKRGKIIYQRDCIDNIGWDTLMFDYLKHP